MRVFAGFLGVGLKTKAGAGLVKAWNMATNQEYCMEGHTVRPLRLPRPLRWLCCRASSGVLLCAAPGWLVVAVVAMTAAGWRGWPCFGFVSPEGPYLACASACGGSQGPAAAACVHTRPPRRAAAPPHPGLQGAVQALAAAGDMLFSAGQDQTLRVWKLDGASNQWQCVAVLKQEQGGHRAPIACLWASHPFLFSADYLGTLKVRLPGVGEFGGSRGQGPACKLGQLLLRQSMWGSAGRRTAASCSCLEC